MILENLGKPAWRSRDGKIELSKPKNPRFLLPSGFGYASDAAGIIGR
jgi:hypothetical protein